MERDKGYEVIGETIIHGLLLEVADEKNIAHLKINNDYTIKFNVRESIAKRLSTRLYNIVSLSGNAKWDIRSYRIVDFTVIDILERDHKSLKDTFKDLADKLGKYWDNTDYRVPVS